MSVDQREKRVGKYLRELRNIASDPDIAAIRLETRRSLDLFAKLDAPSVEQFAAAVTECDQWAENRVAFGVFNVLEGSAAEGWANVLSAAYYRLAEFVAYYRMWRISGAGTPSDIGSYMACCHSFFSAVLLGSTNFQREYARLIMMLGADGVARSSALESTYPAFTETFASAVLAGKLTAAPFVRIDNPYAALAAAAASGADTSELVALALDHHLNSHGGEKVAGKFHDMNYASLGHSLFPAPVLATLRLSGIDLATIEREMHPFLALRSTQPPYNQLPEPPGDPMPRKLLADRQIW